MGDGEVGRWGDGEMGRWGDGEMGGKIFDTLRGFFHGDSWFDEST
ncbi:MAG: hypothetical protein AAF915_19980 [Cyanobacteria bacterium P01_D01_bin.50]